MQPSDRSRQESDRADAAARAAEHAAVKLDALPSDLPADVMDAIAAAGDVADRLAEAGRQLHFAADPGSGRVTIEMQDSDGKVIRTITPSKVLDIAEGGPVDS